MSPPDLPPLYGLTRADLAGHFARWGVASPHVARLWRYLYREQAPSVADMIELPVRLRERLLDSMSLDLPRLVRTVDSDDQHTRKYLLALDDGCTIETVLMRQRHRWTVCLSSQVGCPLGCVFCATGQMGFSRHLTTAEMVSQVIFVERVLRAEQAGPVRNVVVMGMGEPLLNYDAVLKSLDLLHDPGGLALSGKHMTLSTVGVVPGIIRLADERRPYSLAVSLHAATQDARAALLPAARTWPLDELLAACRYYTRQLDRRVFFEWTLIAGQNDSVDQARQLAALVRDIPAQVNLIPLNRTRGYLGEPGEHGAVERFHRTLREQGVKVSVRQRRGIDIAAGCGQLAG